MSAVPEPHVPPETRGKHKTIAVIAAAWHLRSLVRAALENKRTRILDVTTLQEFDTVARSERIDLIILDDECASDETASSNGRDQPSLAFADVPVVLLTDRAHKNHAPSPYALPPTRTLHKHFSPFELLNVVYALIGY